MKPPSIKIKVTLIASASILLLLILVSAIQLYFFKAELKQVLETQQFALITRVAEEIEQKILVRLETLASVAKILPADELAHPDRLQENIANRPGLQSLFDTIAVVAANGDVVAGLPYDARRAGVNLADRVWFRETVANARPLVAGPVRSRLLGDPQAVLAAPIVDHGGKAVGVLFGTLNLLKPNFLGKIGESRVGKSGTFALFTRSRLIVMSSDKSLVMTQGPAPGVSPYFDHAMAGMEGTEGNVDSSGLHALFSYKQLQSVPWVLVASLPVEEAYAPIVATQNTIVEVMFVFAILLAPAIWLGVRYLLAPLLALHNAIRRARNEPAAIPVVLTRTYDEIGDLAADFTAMMHERARADEERRLASDRIRASEAQLQAFMNHSRSVMFIKDLEGRYLHVNEAFARAFGLEHRSILFRTDADLFPPDQAAHFQTNDARVLSGGAEVEVQETAHYTDGTHTSIVSKFPIYDSGGQVAALGGVVTDVTERIRGEEALKASEDRLRTITDNVPVLIAYIDAERRFRFNNRTYEEWYRVSRREITGREMREVIGEQAYRHDQPCIDEALAGHDVTFETEICQGDANRHVRVHYVPHVGSQNQVLGFYSLVNDITEMKLAERELTQLARYDSLTGLPNRSSAHEQIIQANARARRNRRTAALMYLDIDHFKTINDTYGHAVGDAVLKEFSGRLKRSVRDTDTVARLSGDEFVIVLEGLVRPEDARCVAEKILAAMGPSFHLDGQELQVATSVGIAFTTGEMPDADALLKQADQAMYRAKQAGRNNYRIHAADDDRSPNLTN